MGDVGVGMTPLRGELIDEFQLRGFSIHIQDSDVRSVTGLAPFSQRSPGQIVDDEINAYPLRLLRFKEVLFQVSTMAKTTVTALAMFAAQSPTVPEST